YGLMVFCGPGRGFIGSTDPCEGDLSGRIEKAEPNHGAKLATQRLIDLMLTEGTSSESGSEGLRDVRSRPENLIDSVADRRADRFVIGPIVLVFRHHQWNRVGVGRNDSVDAPFAI